MMLLRRVLCSACCALVVSVLVDARLRSDWQSDGESETGRYRARARVPRNNRRKSDKPNIVFVITDDQDTELGEIILLLC